MTHTIESFNKAVREALNSLEGEDITHAEISWSHGIVEIKPVAGGYRLFDEDDTNITPRQVNPLADLDKLLNHLKSKNINAQWFERLMYSLFNESQDMFIAKGEQVVKLDLDERRRFAYGFLDLLEAAKVISDHYEKVSE